eukprot:14879517-Alexandrium_andersonii.AAC.1
MPSSLSESSDSVRAAPASGLSPRSLDPGSPTALPPEALPDLPSASSAEPLHLQMASALPPPPVLPTVATSPAPPIPPTPVP